MRLHLGVAQSTKSRLPNGLDAASLHGKFCFLKISRSGKKFSKCCFLLFASVVHKTSFKFIWTIKRSRSSPLQRICGRLIKVWKPCIYWDGIPDTNGFWCQALHPHVEPHLGLMELVPLLTEVVHLSWSIRHLVLLVLRHLWTT